MKKIVLASGNKGKIAEIKALFEHLSIELISQADLNVPEADETGTTFIENAIIKARNASEHTGLPAIADDSGLVVNALNGEPGVHSSRYASTNDERIAKVLRELEKTNNDDRAASFHCVLAYIRSANDPAPIVAHGIWHGEITLEPRGNKGFGYDPIFYVSEYDKTAAELDPALKNRISHRGHAIELFFKRFNDEVAMPERMADNKS